MRDRHLTSQVSAFRNLGCRILHLLALNRLLILLAFKLSLGRKMAYARMWRPLSSECVVGRSEIISLVQCPVIGWPTWRRPALSNAQGLFANVQRQPTLPDMPFHPFFPSLRYGHRRRFPWLPVLGQAGCGQRSPPSDPPQPGAIALLGGPPANYVFLPQLGKCVLLKPRIKFGLRVPLQRRFPAPSVYHHDILGGKAIDQRNGLCCQNDLNPLRGRPDQAGEDFDGVRMKT